MTLLFLVVVCMSTGILSIKYIDKLSLNYYVI